MLSCSSHREESYCWLLGLCGQLTHVSVLSLAPLQSTNTWGFCGAATSHREWKALVLAAVMLLGDGLDSSLSGIFKDQVLLEGVIALPGPSLCGL